jgi:hypothetical protein
MDVRVDTLAADSGRITDHPEVIDSSVGLVPANALVSNRSGHLTADLQCEVFTELHPYREESDRVSRDLGGSEEGRTEVRARPGYYIAGPEI